MTNPSQSFGFGTPFQEQIDYLLGKLNLPSEKWDDIKGAANDRAFIVAGAAKADLLTDLHNALGQAATDGSGFQSFQKNFKAAVAKHGWTGWTGEGTPAGEAWRARIIYQTNMLTSYWAGRYKQMTDPEVLKLHPYWRYIHSDSVLHPREKHLEWHGLTLLASHPFWRTHFAPNGYGCMCSITSVTRKEGEASARAGLGDPPAGWDQIDPKTGEQIGIGKGFGYAPGASVNMPLRQMVQDKLITYPDAIATALSRDVNRYINASERASVFAARMLTQRANVEPLWIGFVDAPQELTKLLGRDVKGYTLLIPSDAPRHIDASHAFDGGSQRTPVPADFNFVAEVLNQAEKVRVGDPSRNGNATIVAIKTIGQEIYRAVFEVLAGKKSRALALSSLVIKALK